MIRGWLLLSTLVFGVLFRSFRQYAVGQMYFPFSSKEMDAQTYVYYLMEHISAITVGLCLLIKDETPRWLIQLFILILIIDLFHYILFFRDEGIGFNLIKVIVFGLPLAWIQSKQLLNQ